IETDGSWVREAALDPNSGWLLSSPLKTHLWHLFAVSLLYALYYSVAFMLEVAYQYEEYRARAWSIAPLIFLWVMGTSLVGLCEGLRRTARGSTLGILFSVSIFLGSALML